MRPGPLELMQKTELDFLGSLIRNEPKTGFRMHAQVQKSTLKSFLLRHKSYQETVGSETMSLYRSRRIKYQQLFPSLINYKWAEMSRKKQTSDGNNMRFASYEHIEKL